MKNALTIVGLSALFAVVLFIGALYGLERYLKANKFGEEMEAAAKQALADAAKDLSYLPPDGVTIKKGVADDRLCYADRNEACAAAMKLVPKEPCANNMQLVDSMPPSCDCTYDQVCHEDNRWSCEVKWSFICDTNAECAKHSDCPGKGWICRERRCEKFE